MKIIPVIDILKGLAVHGLAYMKREYKPLKSILSDSPDPVEVAKAYKSRFGFEELYIADLDAILGGKPNLSLLRKIKNETNLKLMVDAGVTTTDKVDELFDVGASKVVIGTENLFDLNFIEESVRKFGEKQIIVSIDMEEEKILSKSPFMSSMNLLGLAEKLQNLGLPTLILLDLSRVGTRRGINIDIVKTIASKVVIEIFVGGGVRGIGDLLRLRELKVDGVLLATLLHMGEISREKLVSEGFL